MIRTVLIADDHPMVRAAMTHAVRAVVPGCEVFEVSGFKALEAAAHKHAYADLVLLDLNMPGAHGFSALLFLRAEHPAVPVIVVSSSEDARTVRRAYRYGAAGFLPKSAAVETIHAAIRAVLDGKEWFPSLPALENDAEEETAKRLAKLTPQQVRVLMAIAEGKPNKRIAQDLGIADNTLKVHISAIFRTLGVANRTQAALLLKSLESESAREVDED